MHLRLADLPHLIGRQVVGVAAGNNDVIQGGCILDVLEHVLPAPPTASDALLAYCVSFGTNCISTSAEATVDWAHRSGCNDLVSCCPVPQGGSYQGREPCPDIGGRDL